MKTITISSLFVLSALVVGMVAMPPATFADHAEVTVVPVDGSSVPGCNETDEGCYTPLVATIDVGGKVIFSNTDVVAHVFAAGTIDDGLSGEFDSSLVLPGASFEWTPEEVGEVQHFCYVHPWMFGTINVQEAAAMMDDKKMDDGHMKMEDASVTGMLSDGTVVKIWASAPAEGEMMEISIKFANYGDAMMKDEMMEDDAMMKDEMMEDDAMMKDEMMEDDAMMKDEMMEDDAMMKDEMMEDDAMMKDEMMEDDAMMKDEMMEDDAMMKDEMMEDDAMMKDEMMEDDAMMKDEMMEDDAMMKDEMMDGKTGVEHVNYDIAITQNGVNVLNDEGAHSHDGRATHTTAALASADPVEITVTFNGFGLPDTEFTGPVGEVATFMNVVPEFGTIAMMVLAVAIIGTVAVTAKSRVIPRL